jgi:hypothetical protein
MILFFKLYRPFLYCGNCSDVSTTLINDNNVGYSDGLSLFVYGIDDAGCRTATMVCSAAMTNLDKLTSIVADSHVYSSGTGVASVQLTCNSNGTWLINNSPQPVSFKNINCQYEMAENKTCE